MSNANINIIERRKYFKREARFLLRCNYVKQIFMTAVVILISLGLKSAKINIVGLFGFEYSSASLPFDIAFDMIMFLITLPLYIGIIYVDAGLFDGINVPVGGMFQYFMSPSDLIECYRFVLSMGVRLCAFALPFLMFGAMISSVRGLLEQIFPDSVAVDIVMLCISAVYAAAFIICAIFMTRYFAAVFIFVKNPCLSAGDAIKKSVKLMKRNKIEAVKLTLSFAFWITLSHYLAGAMFIFFTLPYIMLSYSSFVSYLLIEKEKDGEFLAPASDYIDGESNSDFSDLAQAFENKKNPFDIIDIDENYLDIEQNKKADGYDTVMSQKTKIK